MVHILLLILKVTGILILVLLGLLLTAVCLVLFVPVRYQAEGSWKKEPVGEGRISWLFGAVSLRAGYNGNEKGLTAGIRLFGKRLWEMDEGEEASEEILPPAKKAVKKNDTAKKEPSRERRRAEAPEENTGTSGGKAREPEVFLKSEDRKFKFSFRPFCDKLKHIRDMAEKKRNWIEDEKNQASLRLLWKQAGRFLRHVCPREGKGSVAFGFEDPYFTGQALSAAALIYPFFEGNMEICPVFDEKIFEAEGSFKGRIRAGYLLWLGLGILRDRHTRRMLLGFLK